MVNVISYLLYRAIQIEQNIIERKREKMNSINAINSTALRWHHHHHAETCLFYEFGFGIFFSRVVSC